MKISLKEYETHSRTSLSSAGQWKECEGMPNALESGEYPNDATADTLRGNAMHYVAEQALKSKGYSAVIYNHAGCLFSVPSNPDLEYCFEGDDVEKVEKYVNWCASMAARPGVQSGVEKYFSLRPLYANGLNGGTTDFYTVNYANKQADVVDLKCGTQIRYAKGDWQTNGYALALMMALNASKLSREEMDTVGPWRTWGVNDWTVNIHVWRTEAEGHELDSHSIKVEDLRTWAFRQLIPAVKATNLPTAQLTPGDHCQFCKVLDCGKRVDIKPAVQIAATQGANSSIASKLTNEQIAFLVNNATKIRTVIESAVRLAEHRYSKGDAFYTENFKWVQGRRNRSLQQDLLLDPFGQVSELIPEDQLFTKKLKPMGEIKALLKDALKEQGVKAPAKVADEILTECSDITFSKSFTAVDDPRSSKDTNLNVFGEVGLIK